MRLISIVITMEEKTHKNSEVKITAEYINKLMDTATAKEATDLKTKMGAAAMLFNLVSNKEAAVIMAYSDKISEVISFDSNRSLSQLIFFSGNEEAIIELARNHRALKSHVEKFNTLAGLMARGAPDKAKIVLASQPKEILMLPSLNLTPSSSKNFIVVETLVHYGSEKVHLAIAKNIEALDIKVNDGYFTDVDEPVKQGTDDKPSSTPKAEHKPEPFHNYHVAHFLARMRHNSVLKELEKAPENMQQLRTGDNKTLRELVAEMITRNLVGSSANILRNSSNILN